MANTANRELRQLIAESGIPHWAIAYTLGVHENTLSRWMRGELTPERRERITSAVTLLQTKVKEAES